MKQRSTIIAIVLLFSMFPVAAKALVLESSPIECAVGKDCFIQTYVDTDSGPSAKDYLCGFMSEDGSRGTDFRLRNYIDMDKGVNVLAAAAGTVVGARDEMDDINVRDINPTKIRGKECGNAVVIDHGEGWQTQYCHLKKNTLYVKRGDKVKAGQALARVGLSGNTSYPHLHFLVRQNQNYFDPFSSKDVGTACDAPGTPRKPMWGKDASAALPMVETAVLDMGFTHEKPEAELARYGQFHEKTISIDSDTIVVWADVIGIQPNDILMLEITDPKGVRILQHQKNFIEITPQQFYFAGKRNDNPEWESGIYTGKFTLVRQREGKADVLLRKTAELYVR